jgi:hypothetical protein
MYVDLRIHDGSFYKIMYRRTDEDGCRPSIVICTSFSAIAFPEMPVALEYRARNQECRSMDVASKAGLRSPRAIDGASICSARNTSSLAHYSSILGNWARLTAGELLQGCTKSLVASPCAMICCCQSIVRELAAAMRIDSSSANARRGLYSKGPYLSPTHNPPQPTSSIPAV